KHIQHDIQHTVDDTKYKILNAKIETMKNKLRNNSNLLARVQHVTEVDPQSLKNIRKLVDVWKKNLQERKAKLNEHKSDVSGLKKKAKELFEKKSFNEALNECKNAILNAETDQLCKLILLRAKILDKLGQHIAAKMDLDNL